MQLVQHHLTDYFVNLNDAFTRVTYLFISICNEHIPNKTVTTRSKNKTHDGLFAGVIYYLRGKNYSHCADHRVQYEVAEDLTESNCAHYLTIHLRIFPLSTTTVAKDARYLDICIFIHCVIRVNLLWFKNLSSPENQTVLTPFLQNKKRFSYQQNQKEIFLILVNIYWPILPFSI
jgi:hypothetical protein